MNLDWIEQTLPDPDQQAREQALRHQTRLTKPPGSLGRLEELAVTLCGLGRGDPSVDPVTITVFAADHGITRTQAGAQVSAYPREVTVQMLRNFAGGGAAISVLARLLDANLEVVDMGTAEDPGAIPGVRSRRVGNGSADLRHQDAMTAEQLAHALAAGREAAEGAHQRGARLFIGGEMGIGNTTAATAMAAALLDADPTTLTGPGTGLDATGIARKTAAITQALSRYRRDHAQHSPRAVLQALGGFEIAALSGAYIACAAHRIPVLVDGFIAGSAALAAVAINPGLAPWLLYSHRSAEPGHQQLLQALDAQPLLDLRMRLGEGSGAAAAVPLLRAAAALHTTMATFGQAGVSTNE